MSISGRLDEHGQPDWVLNYKVRKEKAIEQMLGLARGVICDGVFNDLEAKELHAWVGRNPDACVGFPGYDLYERLARIFADGKIDEVERTELRDFLESLTGERQVSDADATTYKTTALPFDDPPPAVHHEGARFVITGRFLCGTRGFVEHRLGSRGAVVDNGITKKTDYLLCGSMASRDWKHSSYGLKIRKAVEYREQGVHIAIVAEDHWAAQLTGAT